MTSIVPIDPNVRGVLERAIHRGDIVVDIGSGPGQYEASITLAGGNYIATDITAKDYATWKRRVDVLCSGEALPLRDASVDVVFTVHTLYLIPNPQAVFREVRRVLRPGGRFLIFDYNWQVSHRLMKRDPNTRHKFTPLSLWWLCVRNGFRPKWIFFLPKPRRMRGRLLYRLGIGVFVNHLIYDSLFFSGEKKVG